MPHTRDDLRAFVMALGGDAYVSARLGVAPGTLRHCYRTGQFTASWYGAMCDLADESEVRQPPRSMFRMAAPKPADAIEALRGDPDGDRDIERRLSRIERELADLRSRVDASQVAG